MLCIFAGKLMSLIVYFIFYKLLITPDSLNLLDRVFGWFFIEHVYEEYNVTAGNFFFYNNDFRTLIKNLLIVVRNVLFLSHIFTSAEFVLTVSILVLLIYILFCLLKINKIRGKKAEVVIIIYYTFIIYILLLKTFVSFNMFDIYFIFNPLVIIFCVFTVFAFIYKIAIVFYETLLKDKDQKSKFFKLIKLNFYILSAIIIALACFKCLITLNYINNNFVQEFIMKILLIYTYVYYYIQI